MRSAIASVISRDAGSPLATNPPLTWALSQNGLRFESPQRQSVARVMRPCPSTVRSACTASGPFSRTVTAFARGGASCAPPSRRSTVIAPEGQASATRISSSTETASGSIHGPCAPALNAAGAPITQRREWMQRVPSKRTVASLPSATSTAIACPPDLDRTDGTTIRGGVEIALPIPPSSHIVGTAAEETHDMGHVVTFAQQKGGAGKTTVLAHLAAAWTEAGRKVALFDLDPQRSLARWAGLRSDPGVSVIESRDYRAGSEMKAARRGHDYVLADCPGAASGLLESAIRESDLVVAPCQPSVMDVWALDPVIDTAKKLRRPLRILLNRMPARLGSLEEVLGALGEHRALLLATQLGNRNAFSRAMLDGRTAPELARNSTAAAEVLGLRAELTALLARL